MGRRRRRASSVAGMSASSTFDVIFVGAGHNALIAASYLVKEGRSVCLLDLHPTPGGWVRSEETTLPGFVHDTFSALHRSSSGPGVRRVGTNWPNMVCAMCRGERARRVASGRPLAYRNGPRRADRRIGPAW